MKGLNMQDARDVIDTFVKNSPDCPVPCLTYDSLFTHIPDDSKEYEIDSKFSHKGDVYRVDITLTVKEEA